MTRRRKTATATSWSGQRRSFPDKTRRRILRRDPICVACNTNPAEIVDHIVPVAEGGTDAATNGQGMCRPCHDLKSEQERERGRDRRPKRQRPAGSHPGLTE